MIPSDKFKYDVVEQGAVKKVLLKGVVDEDTAFDPLLRMGSPLVLNFKDVASINSCGIRNWVNFLKELGATKIVYEECPPLIVRQLNMVPSFAGNATVASVYVPYVCDNCEAEKTLLIGSDKFQNRKELKISETIPCESCKEGEMELDGHPQQYFAFIK